MFETRNGHLRSEILSVLYYLLDKGRPVMLWQKGTGTQKLVFAYLEGINIRGGIISFRVGGKDDCFVFDEDLEIYIKGEHKHILFKSKIEFSTEKEMIVKIPRKVKFEECRQHFRLKFDYFEETSISLAHFSEKSQRPRKFNLPLIDISERGVAFGASSVQKMVFKPGEKIVIIGVNGKKIAEQSWATVLNQSSFNITYAGSSKKYRIGAKFEHDFDKKLLKNLAHDCSLN